VGGDHDSSSEAYTRNVAVLDVLVHGGFADANDHGRFGDRESSSCDRLRDDGRGRFHETSIAGGEYEVLSFWLVFMPLASMMGFRIGRCA
jgi:hypothetical protein